MKKMKGVVSTCFNTRIIIFCSPYFCRCTAAGPSTRRSVITSPQKVSQFWPTMEGRVVLQSPKIFILPRPNFNQHGVRGPEPLYSQCVISMAGSCPRSSLIIARRFSREGLGIFRLVRSHAPAFRVLCGWRRTIDTHGKSASLTVMAIAKAYLDPVTRDSSPSSREHAGGLA